MKKLLLILLTVSLLSCSKDDDTVRTGNRPNTSPKCNCGVITNDGITDGCYWLEIKSSCSGNKKSFCFDQNVWMDNYVGNDFCVTNSEGW